MGIIKSCGAAAVLAASLTLGGCAGVPNFYGSTFNKSANKDAKGQYESGPKVNDIARHISCELAASVRTTNHIAMRNDNYFIKVFLTLEVDDNLDVTPSLAFIDPLKKASTDITTSVSGDLGGARQRIFTATYTLESKSLADAKWCADTNTDKRKAYRLNGNLGLDEAIDDGLEITKVGYDTAMDPGYAGLHTMTSNDDGSAPSFGSSIKFTITRKLSGLGPIWTLTRFKGPSDSSSGLLNGERQDIDSVVLTFAPQLTEAVRNAKSTNDDAQIEREAKHKEAAGKRQIYEAASAERSQRTVQLNVFKSQIKSRSLVARQQTARAIAVQTDLIRKLDGQAATAKGDYEVAQSAADSADMRADQAQRNYQAVQGSQDLNASQATSTLLTSMLLQGISTVRPH